MLIVQKYGGTSVGNPDRIKNVAARVAKYRAKGDQIVVVVSAMSGVTDNLIKLAKEIMPLPNEREMDVLLATGEQTTIALTAIALHALGIPAVSLTGAQAGIVTDGVHTKARIQNITPKKIHDLLNQEKAANPIRAQLFHCWRSWRSYVFFRFLQFLLSLRHKIPCIGRSSKATFSEEFEAIGLLVS